MAKTLVAYFSASSGKVTEKVAREFAEAIGADIFKIEPVEPYTEADIKWTNPLSRCNREKMGNKDVPVSGKIDNLSEYERVFIGFPIWYMAQPNIINTFCKGYDWAGIRVYIFATSGGSGIGKTAEKLKPYVYGAAELYAEVVHDSSELTDWANILG